QTCALPIFPASTLAAALALALALAPSACAADDSPPQSASAALPVPASGVIGVKEAYLDPEFWVARLQAPDAVLMDRAAIAAQNAKLFEVDGSMHDLRALPAILDGATVRGWIEDLS